MNEDKKQKKLIAVLGMHRSGTSAITRGLRVLDIDLGQRIAPGLPGNNAKGFWEDLDVNALNIAVLEAIGHDWHSNPSVGQRELEGDELWNFRLRAVELLRQKMRGAPIWGMKDPRMCRLLPFWSKVFRHMELDVGYVIAVRHPMSVARSLAKRDGFEAEKSYYLWLEHVVPSILESAGYPRVVVDYDLVMEEPEAQFSRIADRLGLSGNLNAVELAEYKDRFLEDGLRHTRFQPRDLELDPGVPKGVIEAYELLRKLARDELAIDAPDVQDAFARLAGHLQDIAPAKNYMSCLEGHVSALQKEAADRKLRLEALESEIAASKGRVIELARDLAERDGQVARLGDVLSERDGQLGRITQALTERAGEAARLGQIVVERDAELVRFQQALAERDKDLAELNRILAERNGHILEQEEYLARLASDLSEREGRIAELTAQAADLAAQAADLAAQAADLTGIRSRLETALSEQQNVSLHLRQSLLDHRRQIDQILGSRSWRATKILRFFGRVLRGDWAGVKASIAARWPAEKPPACTPPGRIGPDNISGTSGMETSPHALQSDGRAPKKRILLVSYYCPSRAHAGGLRILDIYSLIKERHPDVRLDIFTHRRAGIDWSTEDVERIFDGVYYSPTEELTVAGLLALRGGDGTRYDVVDLQFHQSAYELDQFRSIGAKILFTPMESQAKALYIELKSIFTQGNKIGLKRLAANIKLAAEEIVFSVKADEVVCVSKTDAAFLRTVTGLKKVGYLETGISNLEFSEALADGWQCMDPAEKKHRLVYVAYFGSQTNVTALRWYLDRVHPLVKAKVPGYVLAIVGRGDMTPFFGYRDASVEFVGEVPSLAPQIMSARAGIAPALSGSGFRGKINQYAVYAVPSVVSSVAAQGLAYRDAFNIFVAANAEDFARHCIDLLNDVELNRALGQRARETCIAKYSWNSKLKTLRAIYDLDAPT